MHNWPPRSAGPGGGAGFAPGAAAWNPARYASSPDVAINTTGNPVVKTAGTQLAGHEWLYLGVAAAAFYLFGARHLGHGMIPFRKR